MSPRLLSTNELIFLDTLLFLV